MDMILVDCEKRFRGKCEKEDTACVCLHVFPFLHHHHLMVKKRSKKKRSSSSSERSRHHFQSHHHHHRRRHQCRRYHHPLHLPRCSALPLALRGKSHKKTQTHGVFWNIQLKCVSGWGGEGRGGSLTFQQLLLDQWEKLRGLRIVRFIDENWNEERGITTGWLTSPVADILTNRQTVDGCRIHTHLTQLTGQLKIFVHHSSEELKP